jgi:UDP-glucose 4-epimerase
MAGFFLSGKAKAAAAARPFDALLDSRRIREDLGFRPQFPRLADAMAAGA